MRQERLMQRDVCQDRTCQAGGCQDSFQGVWGFAIELALAKQFGGLQQNAASPED
jgi:hypothetical protein